MYSILASLSAFRVSLAVKPQLVFGRDEEIDTLVLAAGFEP
jgi:hypothetical protein